MFDMLEAWWPAEEEEESLLFKGVFNFFFSSTHPVKHVKHVKLPHPAGVVASMVGTWWPAEEEEALLFKRVFNYFSSSTYPP
jgi:hypothetical protein